MARNEGRADASLCTMSQLLGHHYCPVIPDMQRDYCWGLEKASSPIETRKCTVFVDGLIRLFKSPEHSHRQISIGLLYGYEYPKGSGALNIIDGQQRLTTLYLLMGMIYRRIPDTKIGHAYRRLLVRESVDGDISPRLQYQSKAETMYFLTDLVSKFFLSRSGRLSQIERSKWYFKSYGSDTNALSFLGAMRCIDASIEEEIAKNRQFDIEAFAEFLSDGVVFRYFDLGDRPEAEKAFFTINTTGHPLTIAQNLRAMAIGLVPEKRALAEAKRWNEMEDWFWRHRPLAMDDFLHLAIKTVGADEENPHSFIIESLPGIFAAYAKCVESGADMTNAFVATPMLKFALRFGSDANACDIERLAHLLSNYTRYQKTGAADRQQALDLVERMPSADLLSALGMRHIPSKLLNEEERAKLQLLGSFGFDRSLQLLLRKGEEHPLLRGRVAKVIAWCKEKGGEGHSSFSIDRLEHYINRIYEIWGADIDRKDSLDPVRRALLCLGHNAYPIVRRGDMVLSLCWKDYDWQRLMNDAPGLVRQLIDRTESMALEDLAMRYSDASNPYYFIIKNPQVLDGCRKRQLLRPCKAFIGIYYLQDGRAKWWIEGHRLHYGDNGWSSPKPNGPMALRIDNPSAGITLSLCSVPPDSRRPFRIELFVQDEDKKADAEIREIVRPAGMPMRWDSARRRLVISCCDAAQTVKSAEKIMKCWA